MSDVNKLDDYVLEFDLTLGYAQSIALTNMWGYQKNRFGAINSIQSTVGVENISIFTWGEFAVPSDALFGWFLSYANKDSYQKAFELFKNKALYIKVDYATYAFGKNIDISPDGSVNYGCQINFLNEEARKLGAILKQTNQTKHFCISWK
ncbi:DUF7823 domain-containing protein [Xenorhabdus stockiae]|uniref:DUF7823 domain-containing protein n=1 Tax=Xenorhabdus stockiae TaxID=351614 RepID=UPI004062E4E5